MRNPGQGVFYELLFVSGYGIPALTQRVDIPRTVKKRGTDDGDLPE